MPPCREPAAARQPLQLVHFTGNVLQRRQCGFGRGDVGDAGEQLAETADSAANFTGQIDVVDDQGSLRLDRSLDSPAEHQLPAADYGEAGQQQIHSLL